MILLLLCESSFDNDENEWKSFDGEIFNFSLSLEFAAASAAARFRLFDNFSWIIPSKCCAWRVSPCCVNFIARSIICLIRISSSLSGSVDALSSSFEIDKWHCCWGVLDVDELLVLDNVGENSADDEYVVPFLALISSTHWSAGVDDDDDELRRLPTFTAACKIRYYILVFPYT